MNTESQRTADALAREEAKTRGHRRFATRRARPRGRRGRAQRPDLPWRRAAVPQIIDYAFFLLYALLAIRFVLVLVAARSTAGFVQFIVTVTDPFYSPFKGIVETTETSGHTLMLPLLVAIGAYAVLHLAINRLLRLIAVRQTAI